MNSTRTSRTSWLAFGGLLGAALLLDGSTLARGMARGDALDFQLGMVTLGLPHPTGYPLFTILRWLWVHLLPWGEVTTRANALSTLCGALTVAVVYRLGLQLARRPPDRTGLKPPC